ncbi:MAG: hypothetical protein ACMXYF_03720 [Candidatus Woesearchaeota archaeon]
MKKKGFSLSSTVLVGLIVVIISFLALFLIQVRLLGVSQSLHPDVITCQQNAVLNHASRTALTDALGIELIRYKCPITEVDYRAPFVSDDELDTFERPKEQLALDKFMYEQKKQCYNKVLDGQNPLFSRDFNPFASLDKRFCVVCSIVSFDSNTIDRYGDEMQNGGQYFSVTPFKDDVSLPQYMMSHTHSGGFVDLEYPVSERVAVIYQRTNRIHFVNTYVNLVNRLRFFSSRDYTEFEDIERIFAIAYEDPLDIARECDEIVNRWENE